MTEPIHILSLGVGVQSSTEALMAEAGLITPRPDACGFADTQGEPKAVYAWFLKLKQLLTIPVFEVTKGNLKEDSMKIFTSRKTGVRYLKGLIPAFTLNADGSKGLMGRKCTPDYKIEMIVRHCRKMIGKPAMLDWRRRHKVALKNLSAYAKHLRAYKLAKKTKLPLPLLPDFPLAALQECKADPLVVMWIGISSDEADRMKDSQEPWIKTRWPLIELGMSRQDCLDWMLANGHPEPPRSACTFCPFHSDDEWIRLRDESPEEFEAVVKYESDLQEAARNQEALKGIPFLHDSCVPIGEVDFNPSKRGYQQISLFGNECHGLCGV